MKKMKLRYFELAKRISKNSDHHQHKMACVIVNKNRVLNCAANLVKTHPKSKARYNMCHAEILALLGIDYDSLKGCVAYIYRETKSGNPALARPCPGCYEVIKLSGIKKIYYTVDGGFKEEMVA